MGNSAAVFRWAWVLFVLVGFVFGFAAAYFYVASEVGYSRSNLDLVGFIVGVVIGVLAGLYILARARRLLTKEEL